MGGNSMAWSNNNKKLPGLLSEFRTASDRQAKVVNTQFAIFRRKTIQKQKPYKVFVCQVFYLLNGANLSCTLVCQIL